MAGTQGSGGMSQASLSRSGSRQPALPPGEPVLRSIQQQLPQEHARHLGRLLLSLGLFLDLFLVGSVLGLPPGQFPAHPAHFFGTPGLFLPYVGHFLAYPGWVGIKVQTIRALLALPPLFASVVGADEDPA